MNFTSSRARLLRVETLATIPHGIFAFCPVSLITPRLIVGLSSRCREDPPRCLVVGARMVESRRGAAGAFARSRARIEAAAPLPLRGGVGIADAPRDGADMNVTEIDMPAVLAFGITAAGEGGHGAIEARDRWPRQAATDCGSPAIELHFTRTKTEKAMLFPCCSEQLVPGRNRLILQGLAGST